ncbi:aldolase/citrate lyase family protein [Thermodesulfovibrionales bacterium]|nr:aldolase/citrate lyase family protein [Thermodesulfovibrionales bacterium]
MNTQQGQQWQFDIPEFFNIGTACTSKHLGTEKEHSIAMIIEDDHLGTATISYKELADQSDRFAAFMLSIGIKERDRILIFLKNSLAYPISFFGILKAGMIGVPTSTLLSGSEVKYLAMDSQAKAIVLSAPMYDNLFPYFEDLYNLKNIIVAGIDSVDELRKPKKIQVYSLKKVLEVTSPIKNPYNSKVGEPAYLVYTSGTSGFPKGVLHSHRSLLGRTPASKYWFDFKEHDLILHSGKFNWTYVLGSGLMDPLYHGHMVIAHEGENNPDTLINLIKKHNCTIFIGVPTIYRQIIQKTKYTQDDTPSLRHCMSAGESLSAEIIGAWQERFNQNIYEAIGMSELSYYISHSVYQPIRPGSAGFVQPGHLVKILNPDTLEEVGIEEEGMICVSLDDPGLFLEYWHLEEETRKAKRNGYFFTGDYAKKDKDGYIWFLGRKDDIINTFGYRVSPYEIERIMKMHPKVADCVALGLDVEAGKTIVVAAIIPHGDISEGEEQHILEYGQENLARYKCPKQLFIRSDFPRAKNGKVIRKELVKQIMEESGLKKVFTPKKYRARRSMLYVPANNQRYIEKARALLTDGIIFDLEGILEDQRQIARDLLESEFSKSDHFGYSEKILRVNPIGSKDIERDLELAKKIKINALLFPQIEDAGQVFEAKRLLESVDADLELMINIETPIGVINIYPICAATNKLSCIVVGNDNLANHLQVDIKENTKGIIPHLAQILLAGRAFGLCIIDGPYFNVQDEFACEAATRDAYRLGFDGKALIHPVQLQYINTIFTPKKEEVEKAKKMVEAFEAAANRGKEVALLDGELIDKIKIRRAHRMIVLYDRYMELGQDKFL